MKISETLYDAANLLRERGWCRYLLSCDSGAMCAVGAVNTVLTGTAWYTEESDRLARPTLNFASSVLGNDLVHFNNEHCKEPDDAIAALELVADIAVAEGK